MNTSVLSHSLAGGLPSRRFERPKQKAAPVGALRRHRRRGASQLAEQNIVVFDGPIMATLAQLEADSGHPADAIETLDRAIATSSRTGHRWFDAELHRIRGAILLKHGDADPAPAENAFLTAIAIARAQKTRSFELRAALRLADLYRSTGRPLEAHAVLAPALDGFAPTDEMPEIAEAQTTLAALAETDEVKAHGLRPIQARLAPLVRYGRELPVRRDEGEGLGS